MSGSMWPPSHFGLERLVLRNRPTKISERTFLVGFRFQITEPHDVLGFFSGAEMLRCVYETAVGGFDVHAIAGCRLPLLRKAVMVLSFFLEFSCFASSETTNSDSTSSVPSLSNLAVGISVKTRGT